MFSMNYRILKSLVLIVILSLTACINKQNTDTNPTPEQPTLAATSQAITGSEDPEENKPDEEPTAVLLTATPERPLAASVNGQPIYLDRFEKELSRYKEAQIQLGYSEKDLDENYKTIVLDSLIETELISQAASVRAGT